MAEEMLKVNEFEHGLDEPVRSGRVFQMTYGPESNYSYRAESAEELLSDLTKLKALIDDHYTNQCPRLAALDSYCKARNEVIYNDDSRRTEAEKSDHRAAHNFAKVILTFDVGYNTGVPIKKNSTDEAIQEMIQRYDALNDAATLESELWRDMRKYGRAYELQYRNMRDQNRSVISNVFETFVVYGLDVERTPLLAVRYPKYRVGVEERVTPIVYTDREVITYKSCGLSTLNLVEDHREPHSFGEVPVTEYQPDRYRQSAFEDVIPLIDLYDAAQSDTANYMTDLNEATLVISGDLDLQKYTVKELVDMKKANMLLLSSGINADGSRTQTNAGYIYKQYDVSGSEAYKERLRKDIHSISMVPDLTDDSFSHNQSGEAMKYKLFGFQQISKTSQNGFAKGLLRRYRLLLNILRNVQEADNDDLGDLSFTFTPNLPKAVLDELNALTSAGAEFSQKTLLNQASFVDDPEIEMELKKEEDKEREESVVDRMMFGDANERSAVLAGTGTE